MSKTEHDARRAVRELSPFWRRALTGSAELPARGKELEAIERHLELLPPSDELPEPRPRGDEEDDSTHRSDRAKDINRRFER